MTPSRPVIESVRVLANERLSSGVGLLVLDAPRTSAQVRPGQFVHLRIAAGIDTILRRPFSVHRAHGGRLEILYQILGAGTLRIAEKQVGDASMDIVGPLGTGWDVDADVDHALVVAGGLGAAPMGMLVEHLAARGVATVIAQGAPTAARLVARELFEEVSRRYECATDDGSVGECGLVTALTARLLGSERFDVVYCCGPEAMQRAVARQALDHGVRCQVSLERLMACGVGACLSCVVSTSAGLKRACVDGPVFEAEEVCWSSDEIPPRH